VDVPASSLEGITRVTVEAQSPRPSAGDSSAARETELIARIVTGERELFHELVRPYEKAMYFAAFSVLQNPQDAEDVAQETVLKALRNLHQFRGDSRFSTWLISITINEARARLRHERLIKFETIDGAADEEDSQLMPAIITDWREVPLEALERKELRELLQKAIASLPELYREVLVLRDVQEFNIAETALALGVSEGVVKTRLLRARLMMQKILAPRLAAKGGGLFGLFKRKAGGSWF
jgi:RNA polymerase sigma-70 factor (ECF subfamily)